VHEMAIAQSLLEIVLEQGRLHQLERVRVIKLQIGEMAAVLPESLSFCFELLSKDTIASGAVLDIDTLPVVARCTSCGIRFEVEHYRFICPECANSAVEMVSGRELSLASMEGEGGNGSGSD
jgi:hydrogenase nickel incorporation protein HypA/HybF